MRVGRFVPRGRDRVWAALAVGIALNGLRLRSRLERISVLDPAAGPPGSTDDGDLAFVTAAGVTVDDATRRAVRAYALAEGLSVIDLVPSDLPVDAALDLGRQLDTESYRADRLAPGRGALHAIAASPSVLAAAALPRHDGLDVVEMAQAAQVLKQCAPTGTDLLVVDGLAARPADPTHRLAHGRAVAGRAAPVLLSASVAQGAVMAVGLVVSPAWGLGAIVAHVLQPWLATGGTALRPADRRPLPAVTRWLRLPVDAVRALRSRWEPAVVVAADPRASARRRPEYAALMADGIERFFEPRRTTCPLCGCGDLTERTRVGDLLQHKPGTFVLDECPGCGHVFQNPRLTPEGLDFYYRDAYDGLAADEADVLFAATDDAYRARARTVTTVVPHPRRWLDVGGGHGHFCLVAAAELPDTTFDGLDLSESIEIAARRGWVDTGHRGLFPDLAPGLADTYDVVSMLHYLEHTREPWAELDAARTALRPGGHLLIEVPNPDCELNRLFGGLWGPWFQPQHQHFVSLTNLRVALAERGFEIVSEEVGEAHQPADFAYALWNLGQQLAPKPAKPWLPEPSVGQRLGRIATFAALGPLFVPALLADRLSAPIVRRRPAAANAYRVLARRAA